MITWIVEDCFTRLAGAGLQHVAWVVPLHLGALHDTARVLAKIKRPLIDTFTGAEAAYAWLHHGAAGETKLTPKRARAHYLGAS